MRLKQEKEPGHDHDKFGADGNREKGAVGATPSRKRAQSITTAKKSTRAKKVQEAPADTAEALPPTQTEISPSRKRKEAPGPPSKRANKKIVLVSDDEDFRPIRRGKRSARAVKPVLEEHVVVTAAPLVEVARPAPDSNACAEPEVVHKALPEESQAAPETTKPKARKPTAKKATSSKDTKQRLKRDTQQAPETAIDTAVREDVEVSQNAKPKAHKSSKVTKTKTQKVGSKSRTKAKVVAELEDDNEPDELSEDHITRAETLKPISDRNAPAPAPGPKSSKAAKGRKKISVSDEEEAPSTGMQPQKEIPQPSPPKPVKRVRAAPKDRRARPAKSMDTEDGAGEAARTPLAEKNRNSRMESVSPVKEREAKTSTIYVEGDAVVDVKSAKRKAPASSRAKTRAAAEPVGAEHEPDVPEVEVGTKTKRAANSKLIGVRRPAKELASKNREEPDLAEPRKKNGASHTTRCQKSSSIEAEEDGLDLALFASDKPAPKAVKPRPRPIAKRTYDDSDVDLDDLLSNVAAFAAPKLGLAADLKASAAASRIRFAGRSGKA